MIAKCPNHNLVRITGRRETCPFCKSKLSRPTVAELQEIGTSCMEKARASRAIIEAHNNDPQMKMAAFMSIFEGTTLSRCDIKELMGVKR